MPSLPIFYCAKCEVDVVFDAVGFFYFLQFKIMLKRTISMEYFYVFHNIVFFYLSCWYHIYFFFIAALVRSCLNYWGDYECHTTKFICICLFQQPVRPLRSMCDKYPVGNLNIKLIVLKNTRGSPVQDYILRLKDHTLIL